MEILVGIVKSNEDNTKSGKLRVYIQKLKRVVIVTFTSPYYRMNAGGMVAIPEDDSQVLVLHNKNPRKRESEFYFHSCVISDMSRETNEGVNKNYVPLRDNDVKAKIYMDKIPYASKPVTQLFTNTVGAGLYIQRDFSTPRMSSNVTVKSEMSSEINVGHLGVKIRNEEGDSINLAGSESGDFYASRSLSIETMGPQEYKCTNSNINMRIIDGGDINIENNSFGLMAIGPWYGSVRLKSRYRDITLAALGGSDPLNPLPSDIHIVTNFGKIKLDGTTGVVTIFSPTDIQLNSGANISLNAVGNISINAGLTASVNANGTASLNGGISTTVGSNGSVFVNAGAAAKVNGSTVSLNNIPITSCNPVMAVGSGGGPIAGNFPLAPAPIAQTVPAVPEVIPPLPNAYGDGTPAGGAV